MYRHTIQKSPLLHSNIYIYIYMYKYMYIYICKYTPTSSTVTYTSDSDKRYNHIYVVTQHSQRSALQYLYAATLAAKNSHKSARCQIDCRK